MKKIACIAIDDVPIALSIIEQFCQRHGGLELRTFSEPQAGLDEIRRTKPDIVFLDIEMTEVNGLQIARQLPQTCCFIFTTAYTAYAVDGFNLDAADFLHKPFPTSASTKPWTVPCGKCRFSKIGSRREVSS